MRNLLLILFWVYLGILILVFTPRVYLIEVKADIYLFLFGNQLLFVIESIDALYFVENAVVCKAVLV